MDNGSVNPLCARNTYLSAESNSKVLKSIEVNIKRDTGETVPFEFGRVLLTLHFRQSRPVNF